MHRRTLLGRIVACLFAPLAARLARAATPRVPPIHVSIVMWCKKPDAVIDASLVISGTPEQLQRYYDVELRVLATLGPCARQKLAWAKATPDVFHFDGTPAIVRLIHGQRDPEVAYWALAAAETLSRVGCTMTDDAAAALAACTNPNDPKSVQELCDGD